MPGSDRISGGVGHRGIAYRNRTDDLRMCPFTGVGCLRLYAAIGLAAVAAGSQGLPASAALTASRAVRPWAVAESR
jgi:hypothetical protein